MENEILDYVMETPGNTNPAILNQMIQRSSGGGGVEPFIVNYDNTAGQIDASYNQILSAVLSGKNVYLLMEAEEQTIYTALRYIDSQGIDVINYDVYFDTYSFVAGDPDENMYVAD